MEAACVVVLQHFAFRPSPTPVLNLEEFPAYRETK